MKLTMKTRQSPRTSIVAMLTAISMFGLPTSGRADSVAQVGTSLRIARSTAALIDPQGRPDVTGGGSDTAVQPGDVLSFVVHFTPVPNGAVRGLGGYVTVYIPRNTEVVGGRVVDRAGNTVAPHRGGLCSDGIGPRAANDYADPLVNGSMSQLYADTGIFYSTSPLTERFPDGSAAGEEFLTIFNGIPLTPEPTNIDGIGDILGAVAPYNAHNRWDVIQALGFGVRDGAINPRGQGNTADMYGSAVAGPLTFYPYEASYVGDTSMPLIVADVRASSTDGPWQRIQTMGAEIGRRGNVPPMPNPGLTTRIGIPALDPSGMPLGAQLDGDHALPSFNSGAPADPYTRAVRFAVGELVVGEEYLVEINLRVLATPLDPVSGTDTVCAEVFGGDASAEDHDGDSGGKDNTWRYFLPAPSCVSLPLLFDLDVDKLAALSGERLTYTIHGQNLSTSPQNNVVISHCFTNGDLDFVSATGGGIPDNGAACPDPSTQNAITWTTSTLAPGEQYTYTIELDVTGGGKTTVSRAIYTSAEQPAPGFSTVALTTLEALTILDLAMTATPNAVSTLPATVHYVATIGNRGTGTANAGGCQGAPCQAHVHLPTGFIYNSGTTRIDTGAAGDPATTGSDLVFTSGLVNIPPGGMMTIEFDATVPGATAPGAYTAGIESWFDDVGGGDTVSDARSNIAEVLVGIARSDTPVLGAPLLGGSTQVNGSTTEAAGSTVRIHLRGVEVASGVVSAAGTFSITVPTLFVGERVTATVEASGELESPPSREVAVSSLGSTFACSDELDNDGDLLVDFPDDPDCTSASDLDEAHTPQCADGIDNDDDGDVDFGVDVGCSSLLDDSEAGLAACSNGMDDDGDGLMDFPADPGCASADDVSERDIPACADGVDNDDDGLIDYPLDRGCESPLDPSETRAPLVDAGPVLRDASTSLDAGVMGDGSVMSADGGPRPTDPGGVAHPDGGCGCRTAGTGTGSPLGRLSLLALSLLLWRRRRG